MEGLARNGERVEALGDRHGDDNVGVGEQVAARVVDGDETLTDVACSIGNYGGGGDGDVTVPGLCWLGIPCDFDGLTHTELADLGLIEVGVDLDLIQVGDIDEVFACGDEVVDRDGNGVDGAGLGGANVVGVVSALGGLERGAGVCDLSFDAGLVAWTVTLRRAVLNVL